MKELHGKNEERKEKQGEWNEVETQIGEGLAGDGLSSALFMMFAVLVMLPLPSASRPASLPHGKSTAANHHVLTRKQHKHKQ